MQPRYEDDGSMCLRLCELYLLFVSFEFELKSSGTLEELMLLTLIESSRDSS